MSETSVSGQSHAIVKNLPDLGNQYLFLSFAPSSGIGFYFFAGQIRTFDLAGNTDYVLADRLVEAWIQREFDQIIVLEEFSTKTELLDRAKTEYLRDKKNTYYGILLTRTLDKSIEARTLELLETEQFANVPVSEGLDGILTELVEPYRVDQLLSFAVEASLENVLRCFVEELPRLTFSHNGLLDSAQNAIRHSPVNAGGLLQNIAAAIAASRRLPEFVRRTIVELLELAESRAFEFADQALQSLAVLAEAVNEFPRALYYASMSSERSSFLFATRHYGEAIRELGASDAAELRVRLARHIPKHDGTLLELGRMAMDYHDELYQAQVLKPFPWTVWGRDPSQRPINPQLGKLAVRAISYVSDSGRRSFFGRLPWGQPFEFTFAPVSRRHDADIIPPEYSVHIAFWLSFYTDTLSTLRLGRWGHFSSGRGIADYFREGWMRDYDRFRSEPYVLPQLYDILNVVTLSWVNAMQEKRTPLHEPEGVNSVIDASRERDRMEQYAHTWQNMFGEEEPDVLGVLLGNALAISGWTSAEPDKLRDFGSLRYGLASGITITPFIRFIV